MGNMKTVWVLLFILAAGIFVYYQWNKPRLVNGDQAVDISGTTKDGSVLKLSDYEGEYILLEFWGSWCGPCRKKHPQLTRLYEEFKNASFPSGEKFVIYSYALESEKSSWQRAIEKDGLGWPGHVVDYEQFSGSGPQAYGVRSIPSNFLIDPNFTIIGVNLDDRQIRDILNRRLAL